MRVLAAFNGGGCPEKLKKAMSRQGFAVDEVSYLDGSDIADDLRYADAPYSLLIHDGGVGRIPTRQVPVTIDINDGFNGEAKQGRFDPNPVIRQAYDEFSRRLPNAFCSVVWAGSFSVDLIKSTARVNGQPLELTKTQFKLLRALVIYAARDMLPPNEFFEHVYGVDADIFNDTVKVHLNKLNKKIKEAAGEEFMIKGYGNRGYTLSDDPTDFQPLVDGIDYSYQWGVLRNMHSRIRLAPMAVEILDTLYQRKETPIQKEFLMRAAGVKSESSLWAQLTSVRSAISDLSQGGQYVETIRDRGVVLRDAPVLDSIAA